MVLGTSINDAGAGTADDILRFLTDVAGHEMTIIRDDGVARHVRFAQPGTSVMHFDLITWPGMLCYTGDMGTYVFRRDYDMFTFFRRMQRRYPIDLRYWAEKVEAADKDGGIKEFCKDKFRAAALQAVSDHAANYAPDEYEGSDQPGKSIELHAKAYAELRVAIEEDVLSVIDDGEHRALEAAYVFHHSGPAWKDFHGQSSLFEMRDFWDVNVTEYTHRFVWCCNALAWAIDIYDKFKSAELAQSVDKDPHEKSHSC